MICIRYRNKLILVIKHLQATSKATLSDAYNFVSQIKQTYVKSARVNKFYITCSLMAIPNQVIIDDHAQNVNDYGRII